MLSIWKRAFFPLLPNHGVMVGHLGATPSTKLVLPHHFQPLLSPSYPSRAHMSCRTSLTVGEAQEEVFFLLLQLTLAAEVGGKPSEPAPLWQRGAEGGVALLPSSAPRVFLLYVFLRLKAA
ncbi:UNVERIFIED_CONTAM: hypothetical protein K2H54_040139 [Gekko kuhli]